MSLVVVNRVTSQVQLIRSPSTYRAIPRFSAMSLVAAITVSYKAARKLILSIQRLIIVALEKAPVRVPAVAQVIEE